MMYSHSDANISRNQYFMQTLLFILNQIFPSSIAVSSSDLPLYNSISIIYYLNTQAELGHGQY